MEILNVELGAQLTLSHVPVLLDCHLADLVGGRLSWPSSISVYLRLNLMAVHTSLLHHVVYRPVQRPPLVMNAGVHHQSHCTHHLHGEAAKEVIGSGVQTHFFTQILAIKPPSFDVGRLHAAPRATHLVTTVLK